MNLQNNIIEYSDTCTIYPRKKSLIAMLLINIIGSNIMFVGILWLMHEVSEYMWFWIIAIIVIYVNSIREIRIAVRLLRKPHSLILTKHDVILTNGRRARWKDINSLYFKSVRGNFPLLVLCKTNGKVWDVIDYWQLYASKKDIVALFEKYAGKKLYDSRWH